jgi:hypothetical protein
LTVSIEEALRRGLGARFEFYAKRLRTYSLHPAYEWSQVNWIIDGDVMTCWAAMSGSFSRVRKLSLGLKVQHVHQQKVLAMLPGFLARGQVLSLAVQLTPKLNHPDIIAALSGACTTIEELSITRIRSRVVIEDINAILSCATRLRVVKLQHMMVDYTHLTHLAKNRHLTRLELSCIDNMKDTDSTSTLSVGSFALREVVVNDDTSTAWVIRTLLNACARSSLVVCELTLGGARGLPSILQALAPHTHLRRLSIKGFRSSEDTLTWAEISLIETLNGLRDLEFLHLPYYITPHLPYATFAQVMQSHPQLIDWELQAKPPNGVGIVPLASARCTLPLMTFIALLESSRRIRQLPVIVSMQGTTSAERRVPVSAEYTGNLDVIDVQDLEDTKQLVRDLFPKVQSLFIWPDNTIQGVRLYDRV